MQKMVREVSTYPAEVCVCTGCCAQETVTPLAKEKNQRGDSRHGREKPRGWYPAHGGG